MKWKWEEEICVGSIKSMSLYCSLNGARNGEANTTIHDAFHFLRTGKQAERAADRRSGFLPKHPSRGVSDQWKYFVLTKLPFAPILLTIKRHH